jgi:UDP-3-O-[3-hydroxymyristoyl] glucosamine N-acyltransferase
MYRLKKPNIHSSEIAGLINKELVGENILVTMPAAYDEIISHSFICLSSQDKFDISKIINKNDLLVISDVDFNNPDVKFSYIVTPNPKLDFIKAVNEYFIVWDEIKISESAKIHSNAKIGRNVSIGENVVIGPDVIIGENSKILNNVVITNQVRIGNNCTIKHNSTIGSEGFDFEIDRFGLPIHYPHIGKIIIGDNVWVGANTSIECGKIKDTIIENDVKIDDLVQLGYNCRIGERTLITAGVIVERDVCIGNETLIAPNATVRNNIIIGNNVIVGEGAVVIKNIENNSVFVGNPARFLRKK